MRRLKRDAHFAALPEQLVREWTNASLKGVKLATDVDDCVPMDCGETTDEEDEVPLMYFWRQKVDDCVPMDCGETTDEEDEVPLARLQRQRKVA